MPKSGQLSDLTSILATRWAQLRTKLLFKKDEISRELEYIETLIEDLESTERIIMRERYIKGKEWEQICVTINYGWTRTHNMHSDALDKILLKIKRVNTSEHEPVI